jgi:hypothetical protein
MAKPSDVEKIIEYLQGKIANLKEKLKAYDSPMMQDMAKNSLHLQIEYIRLTSELQANEDNLLAIQKFTPGQASEKKKENKPGNAKTSK